MKCSGKFTSVCLKVELNAAHGGPDGTEGEGTTMVVAKERNSVSVSMKAFQAVTGITKLETIQITRTSDLEPPKLGIFQESLELDFFLLCLLCTGVNGVSELEDWSTGGKSRVDSGCSGMTGVNCGGSGEKDQHG